MTLEPGDVILTGTPAGVGTPRKTFLGDGAAVVAEIDGIGRLRNTVVAVPAIPAGVGAPALAR